tara:strand:- start:3465 stop:4580 length:1116 start_codon:yes stop_codon:yes gene_type:complete
MSNIEINNVFKNYDQTSVVKGVSLTVSDGEFMVLVGPSGCGKSTLLRMIAGLESIDSGTISIDGEIINEVLPKDRNLAMVFQNYALYPHMSVYENLAFGLKMMGTKKKDYDKLIRDTSEILGLSELLDRKPKQLSGGQKQRIAVGRAIVRNPKAFLFDEPLSNLDAKLRIQMRTDLLRLHRQQKATSIYVTHDQVEAMTMADRIAIINKGIIQQVDSPLEVYNNPVNLFVAGFIGSPTMNFITGSIKTIDGALIFVSENGSNLVQIPETLFKDGKNLLSEKLVLGIRPEDIYLQDNTESKSLKSSASYPIDLIEHMGDVSLIHLALEKNVTWTVKTPPQSQLSVGSETVIYLNPKKVHFFNKKSELKLKSI